MEKSITISELQLIIRDSVYMSLPGFFWVVAEISEISQSSSGHCYLELVEKHADETNIKARIKAVIWNSRYGFVKSFFENATGTYLQPGIKVLLKAKAEYHELYGLSIVVNDIDPSFTAGEAATKRRLIIKRLHDEGVFNMNRELQMPLFPQRIAVISSLNAAGYRDFINHLKNNSYGYCFKTELFESAMQGVQNENDVIKAMCDIASVSERFDTVVIIRGGGSQADLGWFDNYNIAFHVTQFPLPVITGIGHDKDLTVTDLAAYCNVKTPTAAADFLIERTCETENRLRELANGIKTVAENRLVQINGILEFSVKKLMNVSYGILQTLAERILKTHHDFIKTTGEYIHKTDIKIEKLAIRLSSTSLQYVKNRNSETELMSIRLKSASRKLVVKEEKRIDMIENSLSMLNPENIIRRGYTITRLNGKTVSSIQYIKAGDTVETVFSDGTAESKVTVKREK
jgi:exodeoxyribonuclease VII large subunit